MSAPNQNDDMKPNMPTTTIRDYAPKFWEAFSQQMQKLDDSDETTEFELFAQSQLHKVIGPYLDILVAESQTKPETAIFTHLKTDAENELKQCLHLREVIVPTSWKIAITWLSENREGTLKYMANRREQDFTIPTLSLCINSLFNEMDQQSAQHGYSQEQILTYSVASTIAIGIITLWEMMIGKSTDEIECLQDEQLNFYLINEDSLWIAPFQTMARTLLTLPLECLPEIGRIINDLYGKLELCISDAQQALKNKPLLLSN